MAKKATRRGKFYELFQCVSALTETDTHLTYEQQVLKDAVDELRKHVDHLYTRDIESIKIAIMAAYYIGQQEKK